MSENIVKENSENDVPLTKVKGQKKTKVIEETINEPENLENIAVTKPKKEKKPRSEKQKAQFQQVFNKRKEILEKKNLDKKIEASKLLLQHDPEFMNKQKTEETFFASYLSFIIKIKTLVNKQQANYNEKILILRNRNGYFLIFNVTLGILWFYLFITCQRKE